MINNRQCRRCGKPRLVVSVYEEKIDNSTITHTITECSDPDCQKQSEKQVELEEKKRKIIKAEQTKREAIRKRLIEEKKRVKNYS